MINANASSTRIPKPDEPLRCLLVQPAFASTNYWNYTTTARGIGAHTPAPPLGLLTVAAMLPDNWDIRLLDLNVRDWKESDWEVDIVCVGGMLPQQAEILSVIEEAKRREKYVVCGGADPSSQPDVYSVADAVVVGEGEASIPIWFESWRDGTPCGIFEAKDRPDVTTSPVPRYELINFEDYVHIGVQFSRGCPFNCEFCDIIELFGRVPRVKSAEQFLAELERLYELGYRGWVDVVDDNFIGNRREIKPMLLELKRWQQAHKYPFFFSTEATLNVADDEELLALMRDVDFRFVFMGIETPEPDLLAVTQKRVNAMKPIVERVHTMYRYGIAITAGFIFGFDSEKKDNDVAMQACIEDCGIVMAMVGLLVALPNTQLTRRLQSERRLLSTDLTLYESDEPYRLSTAGKFAEGEDQQAAGLNFITTRDRVEIYREYQRLIRHIFSPQAFFDRILDTATRIDFAYSHQPSLWEWKRNLKGLFSTAVWMTKRTEVRRLYWRNFWLTARRGLDSLDYANRMMSMYMHFQPQTEHLCRELDRNIEFALNEAPYPRMIESESVAETPDSVEKAT